MKRKYFGTDGIRGKVGQSVITPQFALQLGYAAGKVLAKNLGINGRPEVLIGKDTRISGYMLESALEAGLSAAGVDVLLAGPIPTPAVAYLTKTLRLSAGIVISASHNPFDDNGIKFFSADGNKLSDDLELQIEQAIDDALVCVESIHLGKARRLTDAAGRYIEFCKHSFPSHLSLRGLKLVVDAAHGAAYHVTPHVLRELGAQVIEIGCHPDGININDHVGAVHPEQLIESVKQHGADYGIALDGDADRLQMVDSKGRLYNGDELLYVIANDRQRTKPVAGVVGTLMTNYALELALREQGIAFERAAVGDRYVLEVLKKNGWLFGGESSGHLLCLDCHTTGDGTIAALQVLAAIQAQQTTLEQLLQSLTLYPQILENVRLPLNFNWQAYQPLKEAQTHVQTLLGERGRVLIRASGTEPKLRLMVEADDLKLAQVCVEALKSSLASVM